MRHLKFRAWNKKSKKMEYDPNLLYGDRLRYGRISLNHREIMEDYPIMQYIGLKDKNGTEIYEGDILDGLGFVVYISNEARFGIKCLGEFHEVTFQELSQKELEVIGNVHELLE